MEKGVLRPYDSPLTQNEVRECASELCLHKAPRSTYNARMRKAKVKDPSTESEDLASEMLSSYGNLADGSSEIPDAIDDPAWVRSTGKTPLEFLTAIYRHPLVQMRDRISAAKTVVEYTHRKLPSSVELTGSNGGPLKVSRAALSGLSDKELETMEMLLSKAARAEA